MANANTSSTSKGIRRLAFIGMFSAIAAVLMFLEFPLPFAPPFYKLDFSEIPVLIGTFAFGPVTGVICEFVKILVKTIIKGTSTAFVGELANFVIGCALIVPAGIIYKIKKTRKGALISLLAGTLVMTIAGCFINAFVMLPTYAAAFHMPIDELVKMGTAVNANVTNLFTFVMLCVAPFNLLKGVVVSIITFLLYKRISRLIKTAAG
ncbi:MAG: ECF transporter S component [bacterium]